MARLRGKNLFSILRPTLALALAVGVFARANLHAGFAVDGGDIQPLQELQDGKVYTVTGSVKINAAAGKSALKVAPGATTVLFIPKDSSLELTGGGANGTTGGGAGIEVPEYSTLVITGRGKIVAKGGNAANGADGRSGDNGYIVDDNDNSWDEWGHAGAGGNGGAGGGGAGAGIGGRGGEGGSGGSGGSWSWYDTRKNFDHNGSGGSDGGKGGDSVSGAIYILGTIFANATGGSGGSAGGSAGSTGSVDVEHWGLSAYAYRACGGGGGGGGGAGDWAYGYGRGGYGGGGGGGGGGGATYQASWATDDDNSRGGCGGGGSGYNNGGGSQEGGVNHWGVTGGAGGYGANHGSDSPNTTTYRGSGADVAGYGFFGSADSHYSIEYKLTFSDDWRTNEVRDVKLGYAMPAAPVLPERERYVFKGWYSGDTCYYDESGASLRNEYDHVGDLTLTAKWQLEDGTAALTVNNTGIIPGVSSSGEGWNYDSASGILTLSASSAYSISGSSLDGEIIIRVTGKLCALSFEGLSIDSGSRAGVAALTLAEHTYVVVNTVSASSFKSADGYPGIMLEADSRIVLGGDGELVATGGKGAHDIGFASGITDYGKIFINATKVNFHPGTGRLPGAVGAEGGIYLWVGGAKTRLWGVSASGFEPGAAVEWSGIIGAYCPSYTTADANGKAWLWLPDDTYNFKTTSSGQTRSWDARVNGEHREAREHIETGLLVDGEDVACLARPGWYWNETGMLYITNAGPFTVSGSTKKIAISVEADSTLKLDTSLSIDFNSASQVSPISINSGVSLRLELLEGCQANLKAGVEAAAVSVPEGSTLTIAGAGALTVQGGKRAAGIGSSKDIKCGKMRIEGGRISAYGGSYSPGIGVGDANIHGVSASGELEIAGGTVYAHRSHGQSSGASCDIGNSDFEDFKSVKITGGSVSPYNGLIDPQPVNGAGEKLYMVTVGGFEPQSPVAGVEIPTAPLYGLDGVLADDQGNIYIWLPNGAHYIFIDGVAYVADVEGAPATPRLWESALAIDGEPIVQLGCKGWRYDFASETVVFTNSQRFVVSGSTTNEVLRAAVDCSLIVSNLTVDASNDAGKAPFTAAGGATLTIAGGTMTTRGGEDALSEGVVRTVGGSLNSGFADFGRRPVNPAGEAAYMVVVEGFEPGATVVSITGESEFAADICGYSTEAMYADADGKIYIWLANGRYDFIVGVEKGGAVEATEYVACVNNADAVACEYRETGLLVDGRDAGHGVGVGWYSDFTNQVTLAEARTFGLTGETAVMGVLAANDVTVSASNLVISATSVAETAPFTVAEGFDVLLETAGTNRFAATVPSAAVYVQAGAALTLGGEGVLYAYGGEGEDKASAAIGSGFRQGCGKVVVAGGEVHAVSRADTTPAIGVGETYNLTMKLGGEFEITGGLVYVAGGKYTADIGPSQHSDCGNVTITGGTVLREDFQTAEKLVKIGASTVTRCGKIVIGGGSVAASTSTAFPPATNTLGEAVYPVIVEGLEPLQRMSGVACQFEFGQNDIFADREGKLHLWFPKGWNYFLVNGTPYRVNVKYGGETAGTWMSGVYIDGLDAAYVTCGAWKLVDLNIDLTNAAPYSIYGKTSEFTMRARANLTANLAGLEITRASDTKSPAFLVGGLLDVAMTLAATNTMSGGSSCAAVQVEGGGKLTISGDGRLVAQGGFGSAGIGGGYEMSDGEVAIDGGHIEATGEKWGAGIGAGYMGGNYTVSINGGKINAAGGISSAGIGGGKGSKDVAIYVTGGEIAAAGGNYASGIGCGDGTSGINAMNVSVSISGGKVKATSGDNGTAIGASDWGSCGTVAISGGTVYAIEYGGEGYGRIGSSLGSGVAEAVVITGGAIYSTTNNVSPAAVNGLAQPVFPVDFDLEDQDAKVAAVNLDLSGYPAYGVKDLYTCDGGYARLWLPSTGGKPLKITITMDDGEKFHFCCSIGEDGTVTHLEFITVNDEFVVSGTDASGNGWTYRASTSIVSILADAQIDGVSTNGAFRLHVPSGGASNIDLHRLALVARNMKGWSAVVVSNDVAMTVSRSNTVYAAGNYAAGIEVATGASLSILGDGFLEAKGGQYGAGIGSRGYKLVPGRIAVESGLITARGGDKAAGIGGGFNCNLAAGGVVISGGVVRAYGGINAAGVGPGNATLQVPDVPESAVTVSGGTVLAWGGENPRQTGGFGGSKSQSDLIFSLGTTYDVAGHKYKPFVVTGGSIVPQAESIGVVAPRPAGADGTELYSVTVENLESNTAVDIKCDDIPGSFGLNDIYTDDKGRVSIWLAPTNHSRVLNVNGKYFKTDYPYTNTVHNSIYYADVTLDAATDGSDTRPEVVDMDGETLYKVTIPGLDGEAVAVAGLEEQGAACTMVDGDGSAIIYLPDGEYGFEAGGRQWSVAVARSAATASETIPAGPTLTGFSVGGGGVKLTLPISAVSGAKTRASLKSAAGGASAAVSVYMSPTLPFPAEPEEVDLTQCETTDNGDGTATVTIPLGGEVRRMFYKVERSK